MSALAWVVVAIAIFAFGGAGGIRWEKGQEAIRENARMEQARADHVRQEKRVDSAAAGHEADKAQLQTKYVVITNEVHDVIKSDFYGAGAPACLDDAGLRQLNAAIGASAVASEPARAVSEPAHTHWWQSRTSPAVER